MILKGGRKVEDEQKIGGRGQGVGGMGKEQGDRGEKIEVKRFKD